MRLSICRPIIRTWFCQSRKSIYAFPALRSIGTSLMSAYHQYWRARPSQNPPSTTSIKLGSRSRNITAERVRRDFTQNRRKCCNEDGNDITSVELEPVGVEAKEDLSKKLQT